MTRVRPPELRPELAVLRDLLLSTGWDEGDSNALVRHTDPHGREWAVGEVVPRAWRDSWFVELADPRRGGRRYLGRWDVPGAGRQAGAA